MNWISVKDQEPPLGIPILVSNGAYLTLTELTSRTRGACMSPVGFGGYEWEYEFEVKDITHWVKAPALP